MVGCPKPLHSQIGLYKYPQCHRVAKCDSGGDFRHTFAAVIRACWAVFVQIRGIETVIPPVFLNKVRCAFTA